jgi:hypothetical protein
MIPTLRQDLRFAVRQLTRTLGSVVLLFTGVGLLASWLPARSAGRLDLPVAQSAE